MHASMSAHPAAGACCAVYIQVVKSCLRSGPRPGYPGVRSGLCTPTDVVLFFSAASPVRWSRFFPTAAAQSYIVLSNDGSYLFCTVAATLCSRGSVVACVAWHATIQGCHNLPVEPGNIYTTCCTVGVVPALHARCLCHM